LESKEEELDAVGGQNEELRQQVESLEGEVKRVEGLLTEKDEDISALKEHAGTFARKIEVCEALFFFQLEAIFIPRLRVLFCYILRSSFSFPTLTLPYCHNWVQFYSK
jgi:peptidoglycan hydrolase CwlO-like protein